MPRGGAGRGQDGFFVAEDCHPQTIAVVRTKAEPLGIHVHVGPVEKIDFAGQKLFGVLVQYPATDGARPRLRGLRRARPRQRRPAGDGDRPPRPDPPPLAGGARRGRGARLDAALRRADGLRRAARRLLRHEGRAQAAPARADRGRLEGRRGPARLPAVAADPRAAHPPRQGDEQHLHRAGAARHHGCDVRGLPRPGRPAEGRATRPRARARAAAGPAPPRPRRGDGALLRHAARADLAGEGPGDRGARAGEGRQPPVVRGRLGRGRPRRDDASRGPRRPLRGLRGRAGRLHARAAGRRDRGGGPRPARAEGRVPPPPGLQPVPRRARDAALPRAGCRRATSRSRTR